MGARDISGLALGITIGGAVFLYSGVKGANVSDAIRSLISGNPVQGVGFTNASTASGSTGSGQSVVSLAQSQLGKPYVWDTPTLATDKNPESFDCSGLSMWCYYQAAGIKLTHYTRAQYEELKHRPLAQAQPGDLVFYSHAGSIYHVAIYIGNNTVIEAPEKGIPVRTRNIKPTDQDIMQTVGIFPAAAAVASVGAAVASTGGVSGNRALGRLMAASYGWTGAQFTALDQLWTRESGWSNTAKNSSSGAYGIAQALPESKYPAAGQESGGSSAQVQISWGLKYIHDRYGSPEAAWAHEQANSWY